nr:cytochrome c oxidase subunit II [Allocatelliglobosispora scoriae]
MAAAAALAGCDINNTLGGFGWPGGGVTKQSTAMYDMWFWSVVAALAVGVFVWGLIFWCTTRYRKRGDELPEQTRFNLPIEVLYTVLPVLVIAVLFYYTAVAQTNVNKVSANPDVTVEVVAFKWNWQFNYRSGPQLTPQSDAKTVASTTGSSEYIPILVIPTNRTIRFEETSKDVIHSFWVPEMLFKRDVFPASKNGVARNVFEITAQQEGRYVGRCAELCGTYHSMMNFEVITVSPDKYDKYVAALAAGKSSPEALELIGFTGAPGTVTSPFAYTTKPFDTKRQQS